jgi:signal transduction histidine kinase
VPSAIGGAAFRIVQEALTNVLRHAGASSAQVSVRANADELDIEITDDGRGHTADAPAGLGLRGMFERATALGGRLEVGPGPDGGWRVHAVLPLTGANG